MRDGPLGPRAGPSRQPVRLAGAGPFDAEADGIFTDLVLAAADARRQNGDAEAAFQLCESYLQHNPGANELLSLAADTLAQVGRAEDARVWRERVELRSSPPGVPQPAANP